MMHFIKDPEQDQEHTRRVSASAKSAKRTRKPAKRGRELNPTPTVEQPTDPANVLNDLQTEELVLGAVLELDAVFNPDLPRNSGEPPADQNDGADLGNDDLLGGMEVTADGTIDVLTVEDELERVEHYNSIVEENERIVIISDEDSAQIINVEEINEDNNRTIGTIPPNVLEHSGARQLAHNEPETIDLTDSPLSPIVRHRIFHSSWDHSDSPMSPVFRSRDGRNPDAGGQVSLPPVPEAPSASSAESEARVSQDPLPGPSSTATSAAGSSTPPACPICLDSFEEIRNSGR